MALEIDDISYDLELERAVAKIKEHNCKVVGIQMPDGMKHHAEKIQDALEEATGADIIIWAGSCYGACDLAIDMRRLGCELLIQWGHTEWKYGSTF